MGQKPMDEGRMGRFADAKATEKWEQRSALAEEQSHEARERKRQDDREPEAAQRQEPRATAQAAAAAAAATDRSGGHLRRGQPRIRSAKARRDRGPAGRRRPRP